MMRLRSLLPSLVGCAALAFLPCIAGCGSPHDATVHGVVTLDGVPLTEGEVQFHSLGSSGTAYGPLREGGAYALGTGSDSGLDPGDYKVTVVATEPMPKDLPAGTTPPIAKLLSPERYGNLDMTPFQFTVAAGDNTIDLALTSK